MKNTVSLLAICLCVGQIFAQKTYSPEVLERIRQVENGLTGDFIINDAPPSNILDRMTKYKVKGMSIAVIHDYKIEWAKGYGWADESEKRPVTTETLFEPGSISKTLNALGILKLAQEKKLDLYADINNYLTSWKFPYDSLSKGKKITLAQILSHHAGLSVHGFPGHHNSSIPTVYEVLDGKKPAVTPAVRSEFQPDSMFQYSGGGTTISQVLLADVTGQPYDVWMYENVLKPIGMVNSTYAQPPAKEKWPLCATGYWRDGTPLVDKFRVYPEQAAAGLWMTPSDLANYIIDMELALKGEKSKVLSPEMVRLHLTPYNKDSPAAMGTFIDDHDGVKYFQHSAGNDGFCGGFFGTFEGGDGVVIFLNSEAWNFMPEVTNCVAKVYGWKNFYREPKRRKTDKVVDVSNKILKTYEGIYLFDDQWAAIGKRENKYHFYTRETYADMYFTSPTSFFNEEFAAVKTLLKDEKGQVLGYSRTVDGKEFPKATKVTIIDTLKLANHLFAEIGWHLLEIKDFKQSLAYFKRGAQVFPDDLNMWLNLAHAHLFSGDFSGAMAIYKAHLKSEIRPGLSWEDGLRADFMYFKEHKLDGGLFEKVFSELKIDKPKGY